MKKYCLVLFCLAAFSSAGGCTPQAGRNSLSASQQAEALSGQVQPMAPEGMRLGSSYVSALNEPCYEVYSLSGPAAQTRALCLRNGHWTLLQPIYMTLPHKGEALSQQ